MGASAKGSARPVRLKKEWRDQYEARAREVMQSPPGNRNFKVCIVGKAGLGKGSLINHLLKRHAASVSHDFEGNDSSGPEYELGGLRLVDIPGYDGKHSVASKPKTRSTPATPNGSLTFDQFTESYKLLGDETSALIVVVNNRMTPVDKQLMAMAVESRKIFCIVRTHAEPGPRNQAKKLDAMEKAIRDDLNQTPSLKLMPIRIFKVSIPWPGSKVSGDELSSDDLDEVGHNTQALDFPLLSSYLTERGGLYDELQIQCIVKERVEAALGPFLDVKTWRQLVEFSGQAVLSTLVPIVGPVCLTFTASLILIIRAFGIVGLVEDTEKAVDQVVEDAKHGSLAGVGASKNALVTAGEDTFFHVFGSLELLEIALFELLAVSAESALVESVPIMGAVVGAIRLPSRYKKLKLSLERKARLLHELWIMQNIADLRRLS